MMHLAVRYVAGMLIVLWWFAWWRGIIPLPWPVLVVLTIINLRIMLRSSGGPPAVPEVSKEVIAQAFRQGRRQQLRCFAFILPTHWRVEKIQSGFFRIYIKELEDLAWINVDVDWLWKTEIDSVEAYREYAKEFVSTTLKAQLVSSEITERWGVEAHEFEFTGKGRTGWKITVPFHGTEYGMMVTARFAEMYPAAKSIFAEFLAHAKLAPPSLERQPAFNGAFSIGLPPGFRSTDETSDGAVWEAAGLREMRIAVRRLDLPREVPLTEEVLRPLAADRPNPREPFGAFPFSMKDVGTSGFMTYQATSTEAEGRDWFIAAVELVTGARYLFLFDAHVATPAQTFYLEHFRYAQLCMEIIATMSEEVQFA